MNDTAGLISLWKRVFGDDESYIRSFFKRFSLSENVFSLSCGGKTVSAMYLIPTRGIKLPDGRLISACYLYALATEPQYRRRSFASQVLDGISELAFSRGYECVLLSPAEPELFGYYEARGFSLLGGFSQEQYAPRPLPAPIVPLTAEEYFKRREELLAGTPHVIFTPEHLEQQLLHCRYSKLGFFSLGDCVLTAEKGRSGIIIKELLGGRRSAQAALGALSSLTGAAEFTVRRPGADIPDLLARFKRESPDIPQVWMPFMLD